MNRIYILFTILFFTVGLIWNGYQIYNDLHHPELWSDWQHDPRIYLPLFVIVLPTCGLLMWWNLRKLHKSAEELRRLEERLR